MIISLPMITLALVLMIATSICGIVTSNKFDSTDINKLLALAQTMAPLMIVAGIALGVAVATGFLGSLLSLI